MKQRTVHDYRGQLACEWTKQKPVDDCRNLQRQLGLRTALKSPVLDVPVLSPPEAPPNMPCDPEGLIGEVSGMVRLGRAMGAMCEQEELARDRNLFLGGRQSESADNWSSAGPKTMIVA